MFLLLLCDSGVARSLPLACSYASVYFPAYEVFEHHLGFPVLVSCDWSPTIPIAALWPWPARTEATNWSVRVGCVYSGEACRTDQDRVDVGAYCPIHSLVREFYDYIIGDAPLWGDPVG